MKMKKIYCKFCGLELEKGSCHCEQFLNAYNKKVKETKICDTCDKKIDEDAEFCPYCGIPQNVNGNIKALQKELRGENAVDVLEVYRKEGLKKGSKKKKKKKSKAVILASLAIIFTMMLISFFTFLLPIIKQRIADEKLRKELESAALYDELVLTPTTEETIEETKQPVLELKDMWVKRDGFFYAFDKMGDPVVDDWVTETDENGVEQKYYFDIDGKLVVNSWIDGEYYVGADGAMLKDQATPDGAYVDEDGRVLVQGAEGVAVTRETYVYYEHPGASETVEASNVKSNLSGVIKGVDPEKKYELYVKNIRQMRETVQKGDLKCNIIYYVPVIDGADEREVKRINEELEESFARFKNALVNMANTSPQLPKTIAFNVVEQKSVTSNRMNIITQGRVTPRKGLVEKRKFRFIYDRKSKKISMMDITE
ncbi:MAG: hypothetical protein IKP66_01855 [Lachnospiraceae bacterium]|nr:hypothetical protein [Lachnospiraceae bacterium]